jgi:hypothetical protein
MCVCVNLRRFYNIILQIFIISNICSQHLPSVPFHYCCCSSFASSFDVAEFDDENALADVVDDVQFDDGDVEPSVPPFVGYLMSFHGDLLFSFV